jgi:hypothetical protein
MGIENSSMMGLLICVIRRANKCANCSMGKAHGLGFLLE